MTILVGVQSLDYADSTWRSRPSCEPSCFADFRRLLTVGYPVDLSGGRFKAYSSGLQEDFMPFLTGLTGQPLFHRLMG